MTRKVTLAIVGIAALCGFCWCGLPVLWMFMGIPNGSPPSVPGPENPDVLKSVKGGVVVGLGGGELGLVAKPEEKPVRYPLVGICHTACGPRSDGAAFVVERFDNETHALTMAWPDGKRKVLMKRAGDALWGTFSANPIGESCAMSPDGKQVAILWENVHRQLPNELHKEGQIALVDLEAAKVRLLPGKVLDDGISWFPDGKHLAASIADSHDVKGVVKIDVETGQQSSLGEGSDPIVSSTGKTMLIRMNRASLLVDLRSGTRRTYDVSWPVALIDDRFVVDRTVPTEGKGAGWTESNSPLVGAKPMQAVKVIDLQDMTFATFVADLDPRNSASYGASVRVNSP